MLLSPVEASALRNRRRETAPHSPSALYMSQTLCLIFSQFFFATGPLRLAGTAACSSRNYRKLGKCGHS